MENILLKILPLMILSWSWSFTLTRPSHNVSGWMFRLPQHDAATTRFSNCTIKVVADCGLCCWVSGLHGDADGSVQNLEPEPEENRVIKEAEDR